MTPIEFIDMCSDEEAGDTPAGNKKIKSRGQTRASPRTSFKNELAKSLSSKYRDQENDRELMVETQLLGKAFGLVAVACLVRTSRLKSLCMQIACVFRGVQPGTA